MPSIGGLPLLGNEGFMGILQQSIGMILRVLIEALPESNKHKKWSI